MEHARSRSQMRFGVLLMLLLGMAFAGIGPAHAADTASISGSVKFPTFPATNAVESVVTLYSESGGETKVASMLTVGADYSFTGLAPGSYKIHFDTGPERPKLWNGNSADRGVAPPIVVAEGAVITGVDIDFDEKINGASVSGTVTQLGGGGSEGIIVSIVDSNGLVVTWARAAADGTYTASGLAAGTYKVSSQPSPPGSAPVWFGGVDEASAVPVQLGSGEAISGIDIALPAAASLSGTVSGYHGEAPLKVKVFAPESRRASLDPPLGYALVNPDGSYTVSGLPTGQVKVQFVGETGGYANEWYGGDIITAAVLNVTEGQTTPGIDFTAVPEAVIAGQLKPPIQPGMIVVMVLNEADHWIADAVPAENGSYEARGLPAGSYKVVFGGSPEGFATTWYGGTSLATAAVITVKAGDRVTGIDSGVIFTPTPKPTPSVKPTPTQKPAGSAVSQPATETDTDATAAGGLAETGTPVSLAPLGLAGAALGAAGVVLLLVSRRRSRR